ncbi:MAG: hypothetical protein PHI63_05900 [Patescibacteria group bacterium]|nr:hypothetical protein [Patescibacteria group bacterium]
MKKLFFLIAVVLLAGCTKVTPEWTKNGSLVCPQGYESTFNAGEPQRCKKHEHVETTPTPTQIPTSTPTQTPKPMPKSTPKITCESAYLNDWLGRPLKKYEEVDCRNLSWPICYCGTREFSVQPRVEKKDSYKDEVREYTALQNVIDFSLK